MVKLYILAIILFSSFNCLRSQIVEEDSVMIVSVEKEPYFKGDLIDFIQNEIDYPSSALTDSIEGIVIVSFWIEEDGKTSGHEIVRGIREDVNNEASRVTRLIIFNNPATQQGKPVRVRFAVPVKFELAGQMKRRNTKK